MSTCRMVVLTVLVAAAALTSAAARPSPPLRQEARCIDDAIELSGAQLAPLLGAARDELVLWRWRGKWERAPRQLDELNEKNKYQPDDGVLDDNDQVVFMAAELGARAPQGLWPPGVGQEHRGVEVRVTDILASGGVSYGYLFRDFAGHPDEDVFAPPVTYDQDGAEIDAADYVLGLARMGHDGFMGVKRLSLLGDDTNLVDRSKLRTKLRVGARTVTVTEENAAWRGLWMNPRLGGAGPVRVVVMARGLRGKAYPHRIEILLPAGEQYMPDNMTLRGSVRVSLDLSSDAVPARYRDANVPDGVEVDGRTDAVPVRPLPPWRELVLRPGRLVLLWSGPEGMVLYYQDDKKRNLQDTGDKRSYADNGVTLEDLDRVGEKDFVWQMMPLSHDSPCTAERLAAEAAAPLHVEVGTWAPSSPTATASPTSSRPATPTATVTPVPHTPGPTVTGATPPTAPSATKPPDTMQQILLPLALR